MPGQQDAGPQESIRTFALPSSRSSGNLPGENVPIPNIQTRRRSSSFADDGSGGQFASSSVHDHDHGVTLSGLHWIRPQPPTRLSSTGQQSPVSAHSRSATITPAGLVRSNSMPDTTEPTTPIVTVADYLTRFPAESLHSFSFSQKHDDFMHNRQALLKRSLDFMRDRPGGWAAGGMEVANAQAKISGDPEVQGIMELLSRARVLESQERRGRGLGLSFGPVTGPILPASGNVFEKDFMQSPSSLNLPESVLSVPMALLEQSLPSHAPARARPKFSLETSPEPEAVKEEPLGIEIPIPRAQRGALKRTYTDISAVSLHNKLAEALERPFLADESSVLSTSAISSPPLVPTSAGGFPSTLPHAHGRAAPTTQAIFTTQAEYPWTITASNDLACLIFGVTKSELRRIGILDLVREDKRKWLEQKLRGARAVDTLSTKTSPAITPAQSPGSGRSSIMGNGVTARLLSKPPSREAGRWKRLSKSAPSTPPRSGVSTPPTIASPPTERKTSRSVLVCGDVVSIRKRNGAFGSATLWVQEKRSGLIWVMEEIVEDIAYLGVDAIGCVTKVTGQSEAIWGLERVRNGVDVTRLLPNIPRLKYTNTGALDFDRISELRRFTARTANDINIPVTVDRLSGDETFRISSFPHMAGMFVLSASSLKITGSNEPISEALFGRVTNGLLITELIPDFDGMLNLLTEEDGLQLIEGMVIPEQSFRRAKATLAIREGRADSASYFAKPRGLLALHRDGAQMMVDVQMRVVRSDTFAPDTLQAPLTTELVYALWVTYSRTMHAISEGIGPPPAPESRPGTPPLQPMPRHSIVPMHIDDNDAHDLRSPFDRRVSTLTPIPEARDSPLLKPAFKSSLPADAPKKKSIEDFVILEDMGAGAYGQVKLARRRNSSGSPDPNNPAKTDKVVIKYVTKSRILVDTWTRDRRLGTVPLEIHVLDYLRRDGFRHPNIVEMSDFFEDSNNYYIEMVPHGLPGMDLFDYIELRTNMGEDECRRIFMQVASAVHFLHVKAKVVHRDIKDENVILDAEGTIKLIDFGSATYVKNGPFDVFVGTIDYAAPEVLSSQSYTGPPQDVWALGILLYTILYKENPFYSIDEILDHELRVPYVVSAESIALVRRMLERNVEKRVDVAGVVSDRWCVGAGGGGADEG